MKIYGGALVLVGALAWLLGAWRSGLLGVATGATWGEVFTLQANAGAAGAVLGSWWGAAIVAGAALMMWGGYLVKRAR